MAGLNKSILIKNISELMESNGITQSKLAEILGTSQSNISKALNEKDKKCFSLYQVVMIADHFGISVDSLLDRKNSIGKDKRSLAKWIIDILMDDEVSTTTITKHEVIYDWPYDAGPFEGSTEHESDNEYIAIYFPNYWQPDTTGMTEEDLDELSMELTVNGNANNNFKLNQFLRDFIQILTLYKHHQLPEEAFQSTIKHYLDKLPTAVKSPAKNNIQSKKEPE